LKPWKSALIPPKSLQFGFVLFETLESTFFRNQCHYRLVLKFSCKSALSTLSTPNHYKIVFKFSWKPTPSPQQSLQFGFVFLPKLNEHDSKTKVTTDWFINIF